MKRVSIVLLLLILSSCSTKPQKQKSVVNIIIPMQVEYENPEGVAENVKKECFDLGLNFSKFVYLYGKEYNINFIRKKNFSISDSGIYFDIKIDNVYSGRGMYHNKNMMAVGKLVKNGVTVNEFVASRDSMGGMFALFKSSCSVLDRTSKALANDAVLWLRQQSI